MKSGLTVAALAVLAYIVADVAHEVIGHGMGFLLAGGRSGIFTTTRLIETQRLGDRGGDLFDLGGPAGNLVCAGLAWMLLRVGKASGPRCCLFLWFTMAFSLFWAFGYLLFSGVFARGDWLALVRGWPYGWLWRMLFAAAGVLLYRWSMRLLAAILDPVGNSVTYVMRTAYLAGGVIACAGAVLDPRGPLEILNSGALTSFGAAIGLLGVPRLVASRRGVSSPAALDGSYGWIATAAILACLYILALGPGIRFHF